MLKIQLSDDVNVIISQLNNCGFEAFAVGGCVRDSVLGIEPHDWDVCTNATPPQIKDCFKDFNTFDSGIKHGTISFVFNGSVYEVTTYRIDGAYTDNRHPDSVEFTSDIVKDLARRDFTVNAMAYNEQSGFVDPFCGIDDIKNNIIRCVGNPDKRFDEDALRILRALRFSSVYGFEIEENTSSAIKRKAPLLKNIAFERINIEFTKLLCGKNAESILNEYKDVIAVFIPEIKPMFNFDQHNRHHNRDVWRHTTNAVGNAQSDEILRVSLLLHDIGKPSTFTLDKNSNGHFYGHHRVSLIIADKVLHRLKYPSKFIEDCLTLIKYHDFRVTSGKKQLKRLMNKIGVDNTRRLFLIQRADVSAQSDYMKAEKLAQIDLSGALFDEILTDNECFGLKQLAVNGVDIINLGVKEGREIGKILNALVNAVIDGEIINEKETLLNYASSLKKEDFSN